MKGYCLIGRLVTSRSPIRKYELNCTSLLELTYSSAVAEKHGEVVFKRTLTVPV